MKTLYLPVFWCGFTLSISALYFSSDRFHVVTGEGTDRAPVLMQIEPKVHLNSSHPSLGGKSDPEPVVQPLPTRPEDAYWQDKTDAFLSAAKVAIKKKPTPSPPVRIDLLP